MSENDDVLREARQAFASSADAEKDNRNAYKDDIEFARDGKQWHKSDIDRRNDENRPWLTVNKMPSFIRQVVNDARQNKPAIHVHPADSGADKDTAEVFNGLIRNIEYTSNADVAYDTATECAVSGGFGYFRIGLDYAYEDSFDMDLSIQRILNPLSVYGDPNSTAADSSDWDVAFVTDRLSKAQFTAKYGKKGKSAKNWDDVGDWALEDDSYNSTWREENTCLIAEYWTREEYDKPILQFIDLRTGEPFTTSKEDAEKDEDVQFLLSQGILEFKRERTSKCHKVKQRTMTGVEVLETTDWLGKYIPIIPVYGDEYIVQGERRFRSLIHHAKDAQRQFNYWRTASTELVALAPRVPYLVDEGSIPPQEQDKWETANTHSHPYLLYSSKGGKLPPQRQPLDSGPAAGALQEALNASDDMKAVIGLFDASLGAKSNETSGRAIMARQREGDVSTFHFADNMSRAIRHAGRILIDLIPKVYNTPRIIRIIGEDGTNTPTHINQEGPVTDKKGNEVKDEMGNAIMRMHDLTAGKYDLTVTTGPSFTTRREEAAFQMTEVIRALPESAMVIAPHLAKNLDWPGADEIAEEMERMQAGQLPPEAEKQMQELGQQVQQLTSENQQLKMDNQADVIKAQSQAQINEAKAAADIKVAEFKAVKEIELKQATAAMEVKMTREKMGADVEIGREKVRGDHAIKLEQTDMIAADGERKSSEMGQLGKLIVDQGKGLSEQIQMLAKIIAAPNELVRDPKTGKATGSRKALN